MRNLISRGLAATGLAAALTLGASACAAAVVEKDEVAASVASVLQEQGVGVENMTCPADLQAVTGESMRCEFTTGGQPVDAVVTVTSVEGGTAHYDVHTEARPVAKELLAQKVAELVSEDAAVAIDTAE